LAGDARHGLLLRGEARPDAVAIAAPAQRRRDDEPHRRGDLIGNRLTAKKTPREIIEELYLRCVSRKPTPAEMDKLEALVNAETDKRKALDDVFWALLNSREFMFNH